MKILAVLLMIGSSVLARELPEERFVDEIDTQEFGYGDHIVRVTYADSYVYLNHEGRDQERAVVNLPVGAGDALETRSNSWSEIEFLDGSLMQLNKNTLVEFQAINESYGQEERLTVLKLHKGNVFLHVVDSDFDSQGRIFRVDSRAGSAYIEAPGVYEVVLEGGRMRLKVYRGFAELSGELQSAPVYSGEYATIRGMNKPSRVSPFNSFHSNRFARWAESRRPSSGSVSSEYVDPEISAYSRDLDDHGEWRYNNNLNAHVWVPSVSASWRPYTSGYWHRRGPWLSWVSYDPFGWVTHKYGRWGWSLNLGWHWIPGRYYSPAWVSWTSYDSYLGWCPLGYYNRPYYYDSYGPNITIINNQTNRWTYVNSNSIVKGDRNYTVRRVNHRGSRKITSRSVYTTRDDFSTSRGLTRAVARGGADRTRTVRRSTFTTRGRLDEAKRTTVTRDYGTRAKPRYMPENSTRSRASRVTTTRSRSNSDIRFNRSGSSATRDNNSQATRSRSTPNRGRVEARPSNSRANTRATPKRGRVEARPSDSRSNTRATPNRGREAKPSTRSNTLNTRRYQTPNNRSNSSATRGNARSAPKAKPNNNRGNRQNYKPAKPRSRSNQQAAPRQSPRKQQQAAPRQSPRKQQQARPSRSNNRSSSSANRPTSRQRSSSVNRSSGSRSSSSANRSSSSRSRSSSSTSRPARTKKQNN